MGKSCINCGNLVLWKPFEGKWYCKECWEKGKPKNFDEILKTAFSEIPAGKPQVFDDGRHEITDKMLENKKKIAYAQDDFGVNKYGKPLRASMNYDWLAMIREELADADKYLECEAERKEVVIGMLKQAYFMRDWDVVKEAMFQLMKTGTGK